MSASRTDRARAPGPTHHHKSPRLPPLLPSFSFTSAPTLRHPSELSVHIAIHTVSSFNIRHRYSIFKMHFSSNLLALIPILPLALAAPTEWSDADADVETAALLPDGLPFPSPEQLQKIEQGAHGTLPGLPLPTTNISTTGTSNLQLLAFQEFVEVAFFHELVGNITRNVDGYGFATDVDRELALRSLQTIIAVGRLSNKRT